MTTPQFSPAPWTVHEDEDMGEYVVVMDDNGPGLAHICVITDQREAQANAHLIASAPALYAALKALIEETEHCDRPGDYGVSTDSAVMTQARAALAQAEGREP